MGEKVKKTWCYSRTRDPAAYKAINLNYKPSTDGDDQIPIRTKHQLLAGLLFQSLIRVAVNGGGGR